ncbi:MAG: hypothetical protein J6P45_04650 [Lachnospiraceae bacterium]|nr:hypothetical protein [Lachnospiraceae bacterium]
MGILRSFTTRVYVENPKLIEIGGLKYLRKGQYSLSLDEGKAYMIKTEGIWQKLIWKSSKRNIGFVDESGIIYAVKKGKTVISTKVNGETFKIKLEVK